MDRKTTAITQISVIIPVYNEMETINDTLSHVREIAGDEEIEIIVSDGGPGQTTLNAITQPDIVAVDSPPGRGRQMNAGAALAQGEILLFLHADTRLPDNAFMSIRNEIEKGGVAGAFTLSFDSDEFAFKVISFFANLRTWIERTPYGDQAQFIKTEDFRSLSGFADIPIMEDVELFKRVRMEGLPIAILKGRVTTSVRRWKSEGVLRRTLKNWWLRIRFAFGTPPEKLAKHYHPPGSKVDR